MTGCRQPKPLSEPERARKGKGAQHLRFRLRLSFIGFGLLSPQLWIYGETLHGVRSEDIDCEKTPFLPTCKAAVSALTERLPEQTLYMLRNATSLEAHSGPRLALLQLNLPGKHPATLYVKGQLEFLNVSGRGNEVTDGDVKNMHHFAVGAIAVGGPRRGSYLEFGRDRTNLFLTNRYRRCKIDGMLSQKIGAGFSLFAQIFADVDGGRGVDSIQSCFGSSFDPKEVVGAIADAVGGNR